MQVVEQCRGALGVGRPMAEAVLGALLSSVFLCARDLGRLPELTRSVPELLGWRARAVQLGLLRPDGSLNLTAAADLGSGGAWGPIARSAQDFVRARLPEDLWAQLRAHRVCLAPIPRIFS